MILRLEISEVATGSKFAGNVAFARLSPLLASLQMTL